MKKAGWLFLIGVIATAVVVNAGWLAWGACRNPAWAPVLNSAQSCPEFWFNRYQSLIGALIALIAALVAVRPVWRQLAEMKRQSDYAKYEQLRARSGELSAEISSLFALIEKSESVFRCMQIIVRWGKGVKLGDSTLSNCVVDLEFALRAFEIALVAESFRSAPAWGSEELQRVRGNLPLCAQEFAGDIQRYLKVLQSVRDPTSIVQNFDEFSLGIFENKKNRLRGMASELRAAALTDNAKIGLVIAELERSLFVGLAAYGRQPK